MDGLIDSDVDARGFSVRMGYYLACASKSAYEEHSDWIDEFGPSNRITFFTCGQFRGLVGFLEKSALLAFRGTQNIGNCLTDADTLFVSQSPLSGPGPLRVRRGRRAGLAGGSTDTWQSFPRNAPLGHRTQPRRRHGHAGLGPPDERRVQGPCRLHLWFASRRRSAFSRLLFLGQLSVRQRQRSGSASSVPLVLQARGKTQTRE